MGYSESNNTPPVNPRDYWKQLFQASMNTGAKLGLIFVVQALSLLLFQAGSIASIIYLIALLAVPVMLVVYANRYRDRYQAGSIRYMQAVSFMLWTYLFATLIAAVAYWIVLYFLFQNPQFIQMMEGSMELMTNLLQDDPEVQDQVVSAFSRLSPRSMTLQMITSSLFFGLIYIYVAAIFVRRS